MTKRTRQEQECEGFYTFSGQIYTTAAVAADLDPVTIDELVAHIRQQVQEKGGLDYLQVFKGENGKKLFFIDNLHPEQVTNGLCDPSQHYAMLMYADEY